jgi:alpha-beta hydrolase superfamily lysophospholipase
MNRRSFVTAATTLAAMAPVARSQADAPAAFRAGTTALLFRDDPQFWFETLRLFGATDYGGASFGEVVAMARNLAAGDVEGWYVAHNGFADRIAAEAEDQLRRGHRVSARDGFLRASNYYRSSEFFLHGTPDEPRVRRAYARTVACYRAAAALFAPAIEPIEIPYQGTTLPGYVHTQDGAARPRPTLLLNTGLDGSAEEMHWLGARAAVERGYTVITFDGPGQFGPVHRQGLPFRPDWEAVVAPVVDVALRRADVDPRRIALYGQSFGGYLAPRAAAFESRLAACIADGGVYDFGAVHLAGTPVAERPRLLAALTAENAPELDAQLNATMRDSSVVRWAFTHGMYVTGTKTPRDYLAATQAYHLRDGVAERIACPTLVCDAEKDLFLAAQARQLYDHLTCRKTLLTFRDDEGAGAHCEAGAARLAFGRIFDWLDETLA